MMNTEPTDRPLDRALLELRIVLATALTMVDVIRAIRPRGEALLPHLYAELGQVQRAVQHARAIMRRYLPPEGSAGR